MHKKKNTILVVDPDPQFQKMMSTLLNTADFRIIECETGKQAARPSILAGIDLMLLNLTLADIDGKDVIAAIREYSQVPIIILSARGEDDDIITALNAGADDYVITPFNTNVLLARIQVGLRKSAVKEAGALEIRNGPLHMDLLRHKVFLNGELLDFTLKEYNLLRYLIVHRGKMLTHRQILHEVWGSAHSEDTQYLRVYIGQLRAKIRQHPSMPDLIVTEPGVGYRMEIHETPTPRQSGESEAQTDRAHSLNGSAEANEARA